MLSYYNEFIDKMTSYDVADAKYKCNVHLIISIFLLITILPVIIYGIDYDNSLIDKRNLSIIVSIFVKALSITTSLFVANRYYSIYNEHKKDNA